MQIPENDMSANGSECGLLNLIYDSYITFWNNSALSIEDDIVIDHAQGEGKDAAYEYYYLKEEFGRHDVDFWVIRTNGKIPMQTLFG